MTTAAMSETHILLVDDGELDGVAAALDHQAVSYTRLRGGQIPREIAPPRDFLVVTPRHVDRVRRGSPVDAAPGRPLRIVAVQEDSPAMRRRLRRMGLHLLVRLPADAEIWRLLIARALYRGNERREDPRVAVGSPVELTGVSAIGDPDEAAMLLDLSNRGCRLQTPEAFSIGDAIEFTIPEEDEQWLADAPPLQLRGRVRRLVVDGEPPVRTLAVVFDSDLEEEARTRLTAIINRWASGPSSLDASRSAQAPAIPPCQLASVPDLTLDDETDPPVPARADMRVQLGAHPVVDAAPEEPEGETGAERRRAVRGHYDSSVMAESEAGPTVLIGRDLSAGGMRIEDIGHFGVGDRFRLALHGPGAIEPFVVEARVARDDGSEGYGLTFENVDPSTADALEKLVACLPDVESLEDGEASALGAILSEILDS